MNQDIKRLIQLSTLRDVQMKLKEEQLDGQIIPNVVFEAIREVEDSYDIPEESNHDCHGEACRGCEKLGHSI